VAAEFVKRDPASLGVRYSVVAQFAKSIVGMLGQLFHNVALAGGREIQMRQ
jgi:hypothetical protein